VVYRSKLVPLKDKEDQYGIAQECKAIVLSMEIRALRSQGIGYNNHRKI